MPDKHWRYGKDGVPSIVRERRPATYWFKSHRTGTAQQDLLAEEEADDLPLVNRLRADVERWRESNYRGASSVTRYLLAHWWNPERARRLFFCQLEAVETAIYLLELAFPGRLHATGFKKFEVSASDIERLLKGDRPEFEDLAGDFFPRLIDAPAEPDLLPLRRLGCKMATGSGKTVVMAMLIAWAFCNRGRNPSTLTFPRGVLVCAPNLTIKERLQVLKPEDPLNYYDQFDIVPGKYRELMNAGRVLVTNWHAFAPKSEHREGTTTYRVVNKGKETPEAFAKDRLGDLANRAPILVLNDEGHHCWRPKLDEPDTKGLTKEEKDALEEEVEEARVWLAGLDRINNSGLAGNNEPAILACVDLSATPFYLDNSGYPAGSPFPWLASDFGLVDAIEAGIVKVPRLPVRDDAAQKDEIGRPDPKYYRLWRHIDDQLKSGDRLTNGRPKPEAVYREAEGALLTLYVQWADTYESIKKKAVGREVVPPVLIVVCDNTDVAQVFFEQISGERTVEEPAEKGKKKTKTRTVYKGSQKFPALANKAGHRRTIRIDTKLLSKLEADDGESKDEAAERLRQIINTVGRAGQPGEHVRCVVSVAMLTEGWDATNVTHILGVRAFGSQLLCEQVVGRGLRRMNYEPREEDGLLDAEYVDVYGIPFSLIPFKGKAKETDDRTVIYHHVYPVPERAALEIRMPVVESYTYDLRDSGIRCDVDSLEGFIVDQEPTEVFLAPTRGYRDDTVLANGGDFIRQDRQHFYKTVRFQQVLFGLTQVVVEGLVEGTGDSATGQKRAVLARHLIFPEVLRIVREYVDKKVQFASGVAKRELALDKYGRLLAERIRTGITPAAARDDTPLIPVINSYRPSVSTVDVNYRTARPVVALTKSHLNLAPVYSEEGEQQAIEIIEDMEAVECYVATDLNVGFTIGYEYGGNPHQYLPDFVLRMRGGKMVILEIKGPKGEVWDKDRVLAKNAAAKKWVAAVNNAKRWGEWAFEICRELSTLRATLEAHATPLAAAKVLPFRIISPKKDDHFNTCVPLTSLRAAAGRWSEEQAGLHDLAEWAEEWVTWDHAPKFDRGMFVARVFGDSMEPEIPRDSYCLFRAPRGGSRNGRKLLVWHSGIDDPHTGGQYTLKVYTSEKAESGEDEWRHTRIVLKPLNPSYARIVLMPESEGEVRIIAEFVQVVGPATERMVREGTVEYQTQAPPLRKVAESKPDKIE